MLHLISLLLLLTSPCMAEASYVRTNLVSLVLESDVIAKGTIVALQGQTFTLAVEQVIAGKIKEGERVAVLRFQSWICAARWAPYVVGQQVLVFLEATRAGEPCRIVGAGCEGEWPCRGDVVLSNCIEPAPHVGGDQAPRELPFAMLAQAFRDARECFRLVPCNGSRQTSENGRCIETRTREARHAGEFASRRPPLPYDRRSPIHWIFADCVRKEQEAMRDLPDAPVAKPDGKRTCRNEPPILVRSALSSHPALRVVPLGAAMEADKR
ncbi:MAG: hypothetical protein KDB14_31645 [Planctomycetales bacterium]|nr:hypothetical protein [Planctomycetales bacterium]